MFVHPVFGNTFPLAGDKVQTYGFGKSGEEDGQGANASERLRDSKRAGPGTVAPRGGEISVVRWAEAFAGEEQHKLLEEINEIACAGLRQGFSPGGLNTVVAVQSVPNTLKHDEELKPCKPFFVLADKLPFE